MEKEKSRIYPVVFYWNWRDQVNSMCMCMCICVVGVCVSPTPILLLGLQRKPRSGTHWALMSIIVRNGNKYSDFYIKYNKIMLYKKLCSLQDIHLKRYKCSKLVFKTFLKASFRMGKNLLKNLKCNILCHLE